MSNHFFTAVFLLAIQIFGCGPFKKYKGPLEMQSYENKLDYLREYLPSNPVIVEAGAHYGDDTLRFIEKWPDSTIYSFEPNPHAYHELCENTQDNPQVHRIPYALGTQIEMVPFHVCHGTEGNQPELYEGASSLLESSDAMRIHYQGPQILVPCTTLDHWCNVTQVKSIDLLWLDLEGMELQVLKNSQEILKTVRALFIEINFYPFRKEMTLFYDLKAFLEMNGFRLLAQWYDPGLQGNAIFVNNL